MTERHCGKDGDRCYLCCQVYRIAYFSKPEGELCQHCKLGSGCTRYETRPPVCVDYSCTYLEGEGQVHERPDKVGFVAHRKSHTPWGPATIIMESVPGSLKTVAALDLIRDHLEDDRLVITYTVQLAETFFLPSRLEAEGGMIAQRYNKRADPPVIVLASEFKRMRVAA